MTQTNDEQEKQPANELASASSSNSALNAAAPEDPNLPAPNVPLAPDGVLLEPNRADPDGLLVEVTYPSMSVDDTIALIFNGEDTLVPQKGNAELKVTFLVPKEYVAKTVGKTVQVSYSVAGNTGAVRSQTLDLDVHLIPVGQLTAPQIVQAVGGVLDVGGLQTAADIFVNAWPLIALKQKTWMQLEGSGNLKLPVWQGYEIGSTGAQVATVQRKDLQNLTDGSQLNLVLEVLFDDGLPLQPFPIRTYQIKTAPEYALGALELVGATGDVIDLGVVSGDPVTVHTRAYIGQTAGDRLLLSWAGVAANGTPITYSREYTVLAGGETGEVQFEVPRANLESLGGGTLQLSYQIIKVGGGIQNSPVSGYQVKAQPAATYPAPTVAKAPNGVLNPMDALTGATVTVKYDDMMPTDQIALIWNGSNVVVPWQEVGSQDRVDFKIPVDVLADVLDESFDLAYQVIRGSKVSTSQILPFTLLAIPPASLPTPVVPEADKTASVLDLNDFTGDAHVTVAPWPLIALGQTVWLTVTGPGGVPTINLLEGEAIKAPEVTGGLNIAIRRTDLETFANESEIQVICRVGFSGTSTIEGTLTLPILALRIEVIQVPLLENFDLLPENLIYRDGEIETPSMFIKFISGGGQAGIMTQEVLGGFPPVPGKIEGMVLHLNTNQTGGHQTLELTFKNIYSQVSLWCTWNDNDTIFRAFDSNGNTLSQQTLPPPVDRHQPSEVIFTHDNLKGIDISTTETRYHPNDWIIVDWFRFTR